MARTARTAPHSVGTPPHGYTSEDMKQMAFSLGMQIIHESPLSRNVLVSFDGKDVHALERNLNVLKNQRMVAQPEPDFVVNSN